MSEELQSVTAKFEATIEKDQPPPLPEGLEYGRMWRAKAEGGMDMCVAIAKWDESAEVYRVHMWNGSKVLTLAELVEGYTIVPWRPHDMSDPYCADRTYRRCKDCGAAVPHGREMPTQLYCSPDPGWRGHWEKELHEEREYYSGDESHFDIGAALDREKWTPPERERQSFHLRTGGVFTSAPGQAMREVGKPQRPWLFR